VSLQVADVARAMELGREAAGYVTKEFPPPVKLEFEKARPAGCVWERKRS
jgi:DNA polymerase delta subunit 1